MRSLARLKNLLSAKVHALLDRFDDPGSMFAQAQRDLEEELDGLRQQAAMAIAVERRLQRDLDRHRELAQQAREQAQLALSRGREDLARWALAQRLSQLDLCAELEKECDSAHQASAEVKEVLGALHHRLAVAQRQRQLLAARHSAAQVRHAAQQALSSERDHAGALLTRLEVCEQRWTEAADLLLAEVEVVSPRPREAAELLALETQLRVDAELTALRQE